MHSNTTFVKVKFCKWKSCPIAIILIQIQHLLKLNLDILQLLMDKKLYSNTTFVKVKFQHLLV